MPTQINKVLAMKYYSYRARNSWQLLWFPITFCILSLPFFALIVPSRPFPLFILSSTQKEQNIPAESC